MKRKVNEKVKENIHYRLFAGLSGIRIGFEQAASDLGVKTQCALTSEIKPAAIEALKNRYPTRKLTTIYMTSMQI